MNRVDISELIITKALHKMEEDSKSAQVPPPPTPPSPPLPTEGDWNENLGEKSFRRARFLGCEQRKTRHKTRQKEITASGSLGR